MKFLLKSLEFEPCADKFAGTRDLMPLPFADGLKLPAKGCDVITELLSTTELCLAEEVEVCCVSLLRVDKCHNHLTKLQDYAKSWNTFSRQPDFTSTSVDYFELSQQTHDAIVAVHECLEDEGCLQPTLDPSIAASVVLSTMAGGDTLLPCRPAALTKESYRRSANGAPPVLYQFVKVARGLSLVPSLCDAVLSYCALSDWLYRQRTSQGADAQPERAAGESPASPSLRDPEGAGGAGPDNAASPPTAADAGAPGAAAAAVVAGDEAQGLDYDEVMANDLLEYVAEIAQAAARLLLQLMACSQGLTLLGLHPSALSRLLGCLVPRFGPDNREWAEVQCPGAIKALQTLTEERAGCDAFLHAVTTLLPYHVQALLCMDALLSPDAYDSDLLPLVHKLSYESPASTAALTQVPASPGSSVQRGCGSTVCGSSPGWGRKWRAYCSWYSGVCRSPGAGRCPPPSPPTHPPKQVPRGRSSMWEQRDGQLSHSRRLKKNTFPGHAISTMDP